MQNTTTDDEDFKAASDSDVAEEFDESYSSASDADEQQQPEASSSKTSEFSFPQNTYPRRVVLM